MPDLETRKFALAEAVKLCSIGSYENITHRSSTTLSVAELLLEWLEPPPAGEAVQRQAVA